MILLLLGRLPVLLQVQLQRFDVVVESQGGHGVENIFPVDRLPTFVVAPVTRLGRDEGDELRDALLDAFSGILGDFPTVRNYFLHQLRNVSYG